MSHQLCFTCTDACFGSISPTVYFCWKLCVGRERRNLFFLLLVGCNTLTDQVVSTLYFLHFIFRNWFFFLLYFHISKVTPSRNTHMHHHCETIYCIQTNLKSIYLLQTENIITFIKIYFFVIYQCITFQTPAHNPVGWCARGM